MRTCVPIGKRAVVVGRVGAVGRLGGRRRDAREKRPAVMEGRFAKRIGNDATAPLAKRVERCVLRPAESSALNQCTPLQL